MQRLAFLLPLIIALLSSPSPISCSSSTSSSSLPGTVVSPPPLPEPSSSCGCSSSLLRLSRHLSAPLRVEAGHDDAYVFFHASHLFQKGYFSRVSPPPLDAVNTCLTHNEIVEQLEAEHYAARREGDAEDAALNKTIVTKKINDRLSRLPSYSPSFLFPGMTPSSCRFFFSIMPLGLVVDGGHGAGDEYPVHIEGLKVGQQYHLTVRAECRCHALFSTEWSPLTFIAKPTVAPLSFRTLPIFDAWKRERYFLTQFLDSVYQASMCPVECFSGRAPSTVVPPSVRAARKQAGFELASTKCTPLFWRMIQDYAEWHNWVIEMTASIWNDALKNTNAPSTSMFPPYANPPLQNTYKSAAAAVLRFLTQQGISVVISRQIDDSGWSDRITNTVSNFAMALILKRFFVLDSDWPEAFPLVAPFIRWRHSSVPWLAHIAANTSLVDVQLFHDFRAIYDFHRGSPNVITVLQGNRGVLYKMMQSDKYHLFFAQFGMNDQNAFGCLSHALYVPRLSIIYRRDDPSLLTSMAALLEPSLFSLSVNVRHLNDQIFTMKDYDNPDRFMDVLGFFRCAFDVAESEAPNRQAVIYLISDSTAVRAMSSSRWGPVARFRSKSSTANGITIAQVRPWNLIPAIVGKRAHVQERGDEHEEDEEFAFKKDEKNSVTASTSGNELMPIDSHGLLKMASHGPLLLSALNKVGHSQLFDNVQRHSKISNTKRLIAETFVFGLSDDFVITGESGVGRIPVYQSLKVDHVYTLYPHIGRIDWKANRKDYENTAKGMKTCQTRKDAETLRHHAVDPEYPHAGI